MTPVFLKLATGRTDRGKIPIWKAGPKKRSNLPKSCGPSRETSGSWSRSGKNRWAALKRGNDQPIDRIPGSPVQPQPLLFPGPRPAAGGVVGHVERDRPPPAVQRVVQRRGVAAQDHLARATP